MDLGLIQEKEGETLADELVSFQNMLCDLGAWRRTQIQKVSAAKLPVHLTDYHWPEVTPAIKTLASEDTTETKHHLEMSFILPDSTPFQKQQYKSYTTQPVMADLINCNNHTADWQKIISCNY